jgi:dUTP pyrophosphatase
MVKVKVINQSGNALPGYETAHAAGMDLRADLKEPVTIEPGQWRLIPTGLFVEIPEGYEGQIRPRSGLAFKHGITVLNSPGTIDADYRGEIKVILINHSSVPFTVRQGERIAQLVIARYEQIQWVESDQLAETRRGSGGFGSTGK